MLMVALVMTVLCALLFYGFSQNFEKVTGKTHAGYRGEALRNPLLAAQRMLEKMQIPVREMRDLPLMESPFGQYDTLLLWQEHASIRPLQANALLTWVRTGGHLIMSSEQFNFEGTDDASEDPLLRALQVRQYVVSGEEEEDETESPPKEPAGQLFEWEKTKLRVNFNPAYYLLGEPVPLRQVAHENGAHLLEYPLGEGRVTLLSDLLFLKNEHIGKQDHARFFWYLLNQPRTANKVWLLRPISSAHSLWQLLWRYARPLISALLILLFFWLWRKSRRFGPLLAEAPPSRRRLLEHIEAGGHFLWRHGQSGILLHDTLESLWQTVRRQHPEWLGLPRQDLAQRLGTTAGIALQEVQELLRIQETRNVSRLSPTEFTRLMQTVTKLRKAL